MSATAPEPPAGDRPTVFVSYSHVDETWKDRVVQHLRVLEPEGVLEVWDDRRISGGDDWLAEIQGAMDRSTVAVLLISKDFLTSKFILETEVPYLLNRRKTGNLRVIPVIVHPCAWQAVSWIEAVQCRPKDGKVLSKTRKAKVDEDLAELALEIQGLLRKGAKTAPLKGPRIEPTVSISHLPVTGSLFIGRETERAELDAAWDNPSTNVFSLVAFGGVGKSSLVNAWLGDLQAENWRSAERVFGWSFYSQGTDATGASGDSFVNEALWWFAYKGEPVTSPWEKGVVLARLIRERRTLLVLDGLEPLQHPPGAQTGHIKDPTVAALVRELAVQNPGLCIITTRLAVADVAGKAGAVSRDLEKLPSEAGAALLCELGIKGKDSELCKASEEFGGHALALTLLGTYLRDVCDGDVRRRKEVPLLEDDDEHAHARRVIAKYAEWLQEPELQALRVLGLFDRPAQRDALKALRAEPAIPSLTGAIGLVHEARWRKALARLRESRLILEGKEAETLDSHPLVRAFF
ncbi:MAG TPA: TIR domain-containing protein, partial [Thermoanaerobaculia bacterium]|nr:TIR domain-containing protein [Thermoanaerobaculia bacterium]